MYRFLPATAVFLFTLACVTPACDDARPRIGSSCSYDQECESGVCGGNVCLDAELDSDLDGLTNGREVAVGSNPLHPDSDGDDLNDRVEYGEGATPIDTDGDGFPDLIESLLLDADRDCIPDQLDARNLEPDTDLDYLAATVCSNRGVCAAATAPTAVCRKDVDGGAPTPICDYGALADFEPTELACDGLDNDCDGTTDEDHPDMDDDGIADCIDPDRDGDDIPDDADNCPDIANADQEDTDGDGTGDLCDRPSAPTFVSIEPGPSGRDTVPRLTGSAEPNHIVHVFVDDPDCIGPPRIVTTASADAAFNGGVPVFAGRRSTFSAVARNRGGLQSDCVESPFDYTHLADAAPRPAPPQPPATQPGEILTASNTLTIRLCILPDLVAHVHVIIAGATGDAAACVAPPAANTFPMALDPDGFCPAGLVPMKADVPLPDSGEFIIRATTATDDGLTSECADVARVGHYPDPPLPPTLVAVNPPSPSNDATLTVRVAAERLTRIELFRNGACNGAPAVEGHVPSPAPATGIALPLTVPTDAITEVSARAFDRLGRTSTCAALFQHQHLSGQRPPAPYPHPRLPLDPPSPTRSNPAAVAVRICTSAAGVIPTLYAASHCGTVGPAPVIGTLGAATADAECPSGFAAVGTFALPAETVTPLAADFSVSGGIRSWCGFIGSFDHHTTPPAQLTDVAFLPESPSSEPVPRMTATTSPLASADIFADPACTGPVIGRGVAGATGFISTWLALPVQGINMLFARVTDKAGNSTSCHSIAQYELNISTLQPPLRVAPTEDHPTTREPSLVVTVCALRDRTTLLHMDLTGHGLACSETNAIAMTPTTGASCPSGMEAFSTVLGLGDGTLNSNDLTRISAQTLPGPLEIASPCRVLADITHDDIAPEPPRLTAPAPTSPTADPRPALRGSGEAAAALAFFADATCATPAATPATVVDAAGHWRTQFDLAPNAQSSLYGRLRDAAGNLSSCNHLTTVAHDDVPPPLVTLVESLPSPTSELAPSGTWCGEPGAWVSFYRASGCLEPIGPESALDGTAAACVGASNGSLTRAVAGLQNATNTIYARSRDAAGNQSPCAVAAVFAHDDKAPEKPEVEKPRAISWNADVVDFATRGTAEPASLVHALRVTGGATLPPDAPCQGEVLGSAFANVSGDFAIPVSVPHTEAVSVAWAARDAAGNMGPCAGPVVVVGPASARLKDLAAYQTTPGLAAGTVAFHRPDGDVYATALLTDESTRATAMVFEGCLIANYWQSNGFPEEYNMGQSPQNEVMYGVDSVHASPGDDLVFRLRRMPGPRAPLVRTLSPTLNGWFQFGWPNNNAPFLNYELKWEGCGNHDSYSRMDRPSNPLFSVQCDSTTCTGGASSLDLACLTTACVADENTGEPCGLTRFTGRVRLVGTQFNDSSFVDPMGYSEVIDVDFVVNLDIWNPPGIFSFESWTPCSGPSSCPDLTYGRAELPVALAVPAAPIHDEYVWFQRCRQDRDPQNDEVRQATGHIRVDTTCSSRRVCIEGAAPNCTRWRAEDDLLVFPVPETFPDAFPDPRYDDRLGAHAIVTLSWIEGDWQSLSATVIDWEADTSELQWPIRRPLLKPTFDGEAVHDAWPVVRLVFDCDLESIFVENRFPGSLDMLDPAMAACRKTSTCIATVDDRCVRWQYTSRVMALAFDADTDDPDSGELMSGSEEQTADAWSDPIDFTWTSDDWQIAIAFGPWRTDFRAVEVEVSNPTERWAAGSFGVTNFFGGRPLSFPDLDKGPADGPGSLLAPGARESLPGRLLPTMDMPWATMALMTAIGGTSPFPHYGYSIHFAGEQAPPAPQSQLPVELPSRLVTIHSGAMQTSLDTMADPTVPQEWLVEPFAHGGVPIDAVIMHASIATASAFYNGPGGISIMNFNGNQATSSSTPIEVFPDDPDRDLPPRKHWFWTHVMPPEATGTSISRPKPPTGLDAWRVDFTDPSTNTSAPRSIVVTTGNVTGGSYHRFKHEALGEVPTYTSVVGTRQESRDGYPPEFIQRLTSQSSFSAGLSFSASMFFDAGRSR